MYSMYSYRKAQIFVKANKLSILNGYIGMHMDLYIYLIYIFIK